MLDLESDLRAKLDEMKRDLPAAPWDEKRAILNEIELWLDSRKESHAQ